jgi:hypothetical protein
MEEREQKLERVRNVLASYMAEKRAFPRFEMGRDPD